jgi:hypothetical protein
LPIGRMIPPWDSYGTGDAMAAIIRV